LGGLRNESNSFGIVKIEKKTNTVSWGNISRGERKSKS